MASAAVASQSQFRRISAMSYDVIAMDVDGRETVISLVSEVDGAKRLAQDTARDPANRYVQVIRYWPSTQAETVAAVYDQAGKRP
jgi:hypothetical protein